MSPSTPAVRPPPTQSTPAPAAVASAAKASAWAWLSRPAGSGRFAVRAISASRSRSCTWLSAEAPEESSITPRSTISPRTHGKSAPSGARSMKPEAAETSTSRTMPNFDSSAKAPMRSTMPVGRSARGAAVSTLGDMGGSGDGARGGASVPDGDGAPAAGADADPDQKGPEQIGDDGVGGAERDGEAAEHGGDAERDLKDGNHGAGCGRAAESRPQRGQRHLDEDAQKQDAQPRSEEHTSELQSRENLVCRLLLEKKKK